MGSAQGVFIMAGDQPRSFVFGNPVAPVYSITVNQNSLPLYKQSVYSTFQAIVQGVGAVTATVAIQVSNDDNTGRGFCPGNDKTLAPGFMVGTVNASNQLTSGFGRFASAMIGALVSAPGVPASTTVTAVVASGFSLTMSANATVTSLGAGVQCQLYDTNWCTTAAGTITLNSTTKTSDGFTSMAPWRYVRAVVTNITGTGTAVTVLMGV